MHCHRIFSSHNISGIISCEMSEMTYVWCGRSRAHKMIHRERAAAGQVQMSDAGSKALVEVHIGNMPHGHLLLHNAAAWSIRCTFTSLYIIQTPKHPSS